MIALRQGAPREYRDSLYAMGATYVTQFHGMRPIGVSASKDVMESIQALPWVQIRGIQPAAVNRTASTTMLPPRLEDVFPQIVPWSTDTMASRYVHNTLGYTGSGIKVLVLDNGIYCNDSDLTVWGGYDFQDDDSNYCESVHHGTASASVIAALDNSDDVVGVAPGAKIYMGRVCNTAGTDCDDLKMADAVAWGLSNGMQVISASIGNCGTNIGPWWETVVEAAHDLGVPVVVPHTGNVCDPWDDPSTLADIPYAIAVGGHRRNADPMPVYYNGTNVVYFSAPADTVEVINYAGGLAVYNGMSSAVPHAAGLFALLRSAGFSGVASMSARIAETAVDDGDTGYDEIYGAGRIRAYPAVVHRPSITNLTTCTNGAITEYGNCEMTAVTSNGAGTVSVRFVAYFSNAPGDSTVYGWGSATRNIYVPPGDYELTIKTQARDAYNRLAAIVNSWPMPVCTEDAFAECPEN